MGVQIKIDWKIGGKITWNWFYFPFFLLMRVLYTRLCKAFLWNVDWRKINKKRFFESTPEVIGLYLLVERGKETKLFWIYIFIVRKLIFFSHLKIAFENSAWNKIWNWIFLSSFVTTFENLFLELWKNCDDSALAIFISLSRFCNCNQRINFICMSSCWLCSS